MGNQDQTIKIVISKREEQQIKVEESTADHKKIIIINNQIATAPNTTQIASGAGRSSAAGNNAAVAASNTEQQQSVGAGGEADNKGILGTQVEPHIECEHGHDPDEIVIVINNQISRNGKRAVESLESTMETT